MVSPVSLFHSLGHLLTTIRKCCVVGNPKEIEALQDHARLPTDLVLHILSDAPAKKDDTFEPSFFVNRQQAEMAGRAQ